jgi:curved DNA-binding protein CbpA
MVNWYKFANLSIQDAQGILGLSPPYTFDDLNRKYRKLIRQWHPDVNKHPNAKERARDINSAYQFLSSLQDVGGREQQVTTSPDIDVPDFMQEEITIQDIQQYFSKNVERYLTDFAFYSRFYDDEPRQFSIWPASSWMNLRWFQKYIEALMESWRLSYLRKEEFSSNFKKKFIKKATILYKNKLPLKQINNILQGYISINYETKSMWEKAKDWWNNV